MQKSVGQMKRMSTKISVCIFIIIIDECNFAQNRFLTSMRFTFASMCDIVAMFTALENDETWYQKQT